MAPGTKKTSISLDPHLEQLAKKRADDLGFRYSFSAYVASLIREDIKTHAVTLNDQPDLKYIQRRQKLDTRHK